MSTESGKDRDENLGAKAYADVEASRFPTAPTNESQAWRIGFEDPAIRADVWNRYPESIPIVAPAAPFAFGHVVALATDVERARRIVRCVNAHDDLLAACQGFLAQWAIVEPHIAGLFGLQFARTGIGYTGPNIAAALDAITAAIAKSEGRG